ncbi:MAG TPA: tripartite tricarboxylate transporter substrate binding protein [Ramlibacter sp.]|nr:tripartite tricarboxylate transporter substrate binding protein [Ramlibacter sp.]
MAISRRRAWLATFALTLAGGLPPIASAQDTFPNRPVRIIVPSAPGGALDLAARLVAQRMADKLGQSVVVDNRPGADSLLGIRLVKDAPPDGYTILAHTSTMTALPAFKLNPGFDLLKDFLPIGPAQRSPNVIAVSADLNVRTADEFLKLARAQQVTYGSAGLGSTNHICGASFGQQQKLALMHVPYKGAALALPDIAAGRVTAICSGYGGVAPYVKSGKMRVIGVTDDKRMAAIADVPTLKEQGVDFSYSFWMGLLAPAGTPRPVLARLAEALRFAAEDKDIRGRFAETGAIAWTASPEEFRDHLAKELADTAALVRTLNIPKE